VKLVDEVCQKLHQLSGPELEQVRQRITMLRHVGPSQPQQADGEALLLLDVIVEFLASRGLELNKVAMLRRVSQYQVFADKAGDVFRFMRGVESRTQQRAFLVLAIGLLYDDLADMGIAVSARTMMSHVHRIPAVVNRSFPFYAEAGMLGKIVGAR
jgi:hypothetical protein